LITIKGLKLAIPAFILIIALSFPSINKIGENNAGQLELHRKQLTSGSDLFTDRLPNFWPDSETIIDETTLNINWYEEKNFTFYDWLTYKTYNLKEQHLTFQSEPGITIHALLISNAECNDSNPAYVLLHGHGGNYNDLRELACHFAGKLHYSFLCIDSPGTIYRTKDGWGSTGPDSSPENMVNIRSLGPQGSFLYHNVLAALRGVTVLQSIPSVDNSRIGISGASQGGVTTIIANGVESVYKRIKIAIPIVAAGNFSECIRQETHIIRMVPEGFNNSHPDAELFSSYFDPLVYSPLAHAPTLVLCGTNDEFFPLMTFKQLYDSLLVQKAINIGPGATHYNVWMPWLITFESWSETVFNDLQPISKPSIDSIELLENGSFLVDIKLDSDPRIHGVGVAYNYINHSDTNSWETEITEYHYTKSTYSWVIPSSENNPVSLYPYIIRNGVHEYSGSPRLIINSEYRETTSTMYTETTSQVTKTASSFIFPIIPIVFAILVQRKKYLR